MGKRYQEISPQLKTWIEQQNVFFVATSPLAADGHVNCSPKGMDTFRVLSPSEVIYLDLTGSGVETIAHLRENGRIVVMFCAFAGPPKIVRLHGKGRVLIEGEEFEIRRRLFPEFPGVRSIIQITLTDVSDSCGYAVPRFEFVDDRDTLNRWAESKSDGELARYRNQKNASSWDGLPGLKGPPTSLPEGQ